MERKPVQSSNIAAIGYDYISLTLEVEFLNNSIYQYFDVPQNVYDDLMKASSHGQYLAKYIKGFFRYSKV